MTQATPIDQLADAMQRFPQLRDAFGGARNAPTPEQLQRWHAEAEKGDGISHKTFVEIVALKNAAGPGAARIEERARQNNDRLVREKTKLALDDSTGAVEAIAALCELLGVRVATASAVLSWCLPQRYAVIDWRVWETLHVFGLTDEVRGPGECSARDYGWYMRVVMKLVKKLGDDWTPQMIDRWLYAFSKCQFKPDHFK
jgi:hypothetical protein